jgi:alginate O-acetyltransferase complex protein AlgI
MLFNSLEFAIFFPIVATMYFVLPQRLRTPHLLVSSCVFYMAFIPYILILGLTIVIDYTAGIYLEKVAGRARSWLLAASVMATCLVLFVFKYFFFFTNNAIGLAGLFDLQLSDNARWSVRPRTIHSPLERAADLRCACAHRSGRLESQICTAMPLRTSALTGYWE